MLADCHWERRQADIDRQVQHDQQVTALEREIVMLRASLQVAENTIQQLTNEKRTQKAVQGTLMDAAALCREELEHYKQREQSQSVEVQRQMEKNMQLTTVIDSMIQEVCPPTPPTAAKWGEHKQPWKEADSWPVCMPKLMESNRSSRRIL